jgi:hypothetical protein
LAFSCHLGAEAAQRALQGLALRAADEQQVEEGQAGPRLLQRVAQLEGHGDAGRLGREADALCAVDLLVLDRDGLALAGDELEHALLHAPPPAGIGVPQHASAGVGPVALQAGDVMQAVDERRPSRGVVPQRLGLAGEARDGDAGADAAH